MLFRFHSNRWTKEFKIFPSLFFGFEKPVLAIPNLAHLLLPYLDSDAVAKSKELYYQPFFNMVRFARICASPSSRSKAQACWQQAFSL